MVYVDFLIIRSKCDPATEYTNWIGEGLKGYLESKGYSVTDLSDSAASPENVDNWLDINNKKISKAVIALDHGGNNAFYGERNNQIVEVIDLSNVERLTKTLHVYTLACSTNAPNGLGQKAINGGCYSWLGYTEPVYAANYQSFKDCIWSYIKAMAEGKTIEQCVAILRDAYESRESESFIYRYNLDRLLIRKFPINPPNACNLDATMNINSHNRDVSGQKLSYRNDSYNFCVAAITHYALAAFFTSIPFCLWCLAIAAANLVAATAFKAMSVSLNNQANDPIEFDKNYREIHDFSSLIRKFEVDGLIPIHIKRFGDGYNKIDAQFNSLDITYNRFYSSLKAGDKRSAKIQKEKAIDLAESMEEEIFKLKNHLLKIKKFDEDFKKAKIREDDIEKTLKEFMEKGLSEGFKERLTKQGLSKRMIERINESSKQLRKEDIKKEFFPSFQRLYRQLLDEFVTKKEKIKDMKRVEGLSKDALSRRLLREGLTEPRGVEKSEREDPQEVKRKE